MTKLDKRSFVERLVVEAEEAAGRQDLKTLYRINKMLKNGIKNNNVPVKDTDGNVISKEAEELARWKEYFESILNRPEPEQVAEIPPAVEDLDICIDPPTIHDFLNGGSLGRNGNYQHQSEARKASLRKHNKWRTSLDKIRSKLWTFPTSLGTNENSPNCQGLLILNLPFALQFLSQIFSK